MSYPISLLSIPKDALLVCTMVLQLSEEALLLHPSALEYSCLKGVELHLILTIAFSLHKLLPYICTRSFISET